jgi:superfamily II DNA or RNA helicase
VLLEPVDCHERVDQQNLPLAARELLTCVRTVRDHARLVSVPAIFTAEPPRPDAGFREWQVRALAAMANWHDGSFLISAAPGAGKTRPALEFARRELARGGCDNVVIVCPTAPLTTQWARAAHGLGLELVPDADSPRPPAGFKGVVVTFARVAQAPERWAAGCRERTLVIADEAHHLGEDLAWGESFARAFAQPSRWLLLSGTPFRSDASSIPGVSYDADGVAEPDVGYSYAEAVADGVCRPVVFIAYDGMLSWRSGEDVIESSFDTVLSTRESSRRYRTAISTELPDGLPRILREANTQLRKLRNGSHSDAAGLVVAADSNHARRISELLREVTGQSPVVVLHQDPRAAAKLAKFGGSAEPWLVAVNMVSEGVDIPRLRVGVYATASKTPLVFRQIVGRFVRTLPGRASEPSWLYVPADPILTEHAATVEHELRAVRRVPGQEALEDGELDDLERVATEPGDVLDFEPLSADVAAQMTLFGPAAPPAKVATAPPVIAPEVAPAPQTVPAYERRARLRKERHRLVTDLARRQGVTQQVINGQINGEVGIAGVDKATIEQLERSIELLERRLRR